ncbi:MAG: chemotaxis protein CheA, partial [Magnetospirillum sp.]
MVEDQSYDLSRFKATYFEECAELLASAEETIARLQEGTDSPEDDLNALFRCVHSIKGGGGAFAFEDLVHFAHVFETSMDALRSGRAQLTPHVADILVRGNDVLGDFVRAAQEGATLPADHGAEVKTLLAGIISGEASAAKTAAAPSPVPAAAITAADDSGYATWSIRLTPAPGLLRTGNDPLLMIRELASLGEMKVAVDRSKLPPLAEMDALDAYLSWSFTLVTDRGRGAIEEVFEFVAGDSAEVVIEQIGSTVDTRDGDGWGLFAPLPPTPEMAPPRPTPPAATPGTAAAAAAPHAAPAKTEAGAGGIHTSSIRVDLDRVDRLVNMVGELVITQAMLGQQASGFSIESHPELVQGLQELSHHTRELQESVMAIRAQP